MTQLERIKTRKLGASAPQVPDARPAQRPKKLPVLIQQTGERTTFAKARQMIAEGRAENLKDSLGRVSRSILILSDTEMAARHEREVTPTRKVVQIFSWLERPGVERIVSNVDRPIEGVRHQTIRERRKMSYRR
jgi:hypothetical protein